MDGQDPTQQGTQGGAQAAQSRIPKEVADKYPQLEALIMDTESMTNEERDYWFQILPIMTDQQIQKLLGILEHEKDQLSKLDQEYEKELSKLNDKHLAEWKGEEAKAEREERQAVEASHEAEETAAEAELLSQLEDDEDSAGEYEAG
jgi:hypothetical protein